ncbi:MAG: T9SS type A sorting domain-containing protein [Flavobacteriales bacterium]
MKKFYAFMLLAACAVQATAQKQARPQSPATAHSVKVTKEGKSAQAVAMPIQKHSGAKLPASMPIAKLTKSMPLWQQVIGYTNYDNQSNASMEHRILVDDDGVGHATWMLSNESTAWTDRGTGYNSGVGYEWDEEPVERIEDTRTGWVDLHATASGKELYVCHDGTGPIKINRRDAVGSGTWTLTDMPTTFTGDMLWPRAAVDGEIVHVIGLSEPSGLDATALPVGGLDGNLMYWRSTDGGATWEVQEHIFPELDSNEYEGISSDSYAIDARDGVVAIAIFSRFHDTALLKSTDGGDTWTYTIISDFAIPGYIYDTLSDSNGDEVADTLFTTDATGAINLDENGMAHVFFGSNFIIDDTPDDTFYSYFFTFDLLYWNENYATDEIYIIASAENNPDDGDDIFDIPSADEISNYTRSLASMCSVAEDEDGIMYIVYSGADEYFLGNQFYRHIYVTSTEDNGLSFMDPVELTPDEDEEFLEFAYPSVTVKDDMLHIVAMRDEEPGILVPEVANGASTETNDIIYIAITTDFDTDISVDENTTAANLSIYPSPTTGVVNVQGTDIEKQPLKVYDLSGKLMVSTIIGSRDLATFDLSFLPDGMYNVNIGSGKNKWSTQVMIQK